MTVHTPILPVPLVGPVYFVSNGGAKFPEAVIVLQGYGVTVDLHGETFISTKTSVTSATFRAIPGVPFTDTTVDLPAGPYSEFAANGDLCKTKLAMPVVFSAQNGAVIKQNTPINVEHCPTAISIISHKTNGNTIILKVYTPAAGKLKATGKNLVPTTKTSKEREPLTLTLKTIHNQKPQPITTIKLNYTPTKGKKQSVNTHIKT